jgi:hypothetical protein
MTNTQTRPVYLYSKPLDVVWLCVKCHQRIHAAFPELHGHRE